MSMSERIAGEDRAGRRALPPNVEKVRLAIGHLFDEEEEDDRSIWTSACPVHERSMSSNSLPAYFLEIIVERAGHITVECQLRRVPSGCALAEILEALGLTLQDLDPPHHRPLTSVDKTHARGRRSVLPVDGGDQDAGTPAAWVNGSATGGIIVRDLATAKASRLTPTERLVALCLAYYMRRDRECFPKLVTISIWTGLSIASVKRAIDILTGPVGFLEKVPRPGRYASNSYRLRETAHGELAQPERVHSEAEAAHPARETAHRDNRVRSGNENREWDTLLRARAGAPLDAIPCPSCGVAGYLVQSPGRNGHPPGWWCRRPSGCGFNFPLDHGPILEALTPGARKAIAEQISKAPAAARPRAESTDAAIAAGLRQIQEQGLIAGGVE